MVLCRRALAALVTLSALLAPPAVARAAAAQPAAGPRPLTAAEREGVRVAMALGAGGAVLLALAAVAGVGLVPGEALAAAFGTPVGRFDEDVWTWCTSQAPRAWRTAVVRYDGGEAKPREF